MDEKLNRNDWLRAGLRALANVGPEGLRIMSIAQDLGVTKGSFYWHFRNHEEYQAALMEEWEQGHTRQIIEYVESTGGEPLTKLRNLFGATVGGNARLARAIRSWGMTNSDVREAQARVDQQRLEYLGKLLTALGWDDGQAATLSRWSYCALIGHFNLEGPPITPEQVELILRILTPK